MEKTAFTIIPEIAQDTVYLNSIIMSGIIAIKTNKEVDEAMFHHYRKTKAGRVEEVRDFFQRIRPWSYCKDVLVAVFPFLFSPIALRTSVKKAYSINIEAEYLANLVLTSNKSPNVTLQNAQCTLVRRYISRGL